MKRILPALLLCLSAAAAEPSDEACLDLARKIEGGLKAGDPSALRTGMDCDALLDKIMAGCTLTQPQQQGFRTGVKESFNFPDQIHAAIEDGGSYKLLRMRRADDGIRAVFRLCPSDGGMSYHELMFAQTPKGPKVVDIFALATGEPISETMRRPYLAWAAHLQKGFLEKLVTREAEVVKCLPQTRRMQELGLAGDDAGALKILCALPPSLQAEKHILFQRLAFASKVGGQDYVDAMSEIEKALPGDPCLDLVLIDLHCEKKRYEKALEAADRLAKRVGGDPYLDSLKASICWTAQRPEQAKLHAQKAVQDEPTLEDPYWTLALVSIHEKAFEETARLLTLLETEHGVALADLRTVKEYEAFVQSPAFTKWEQERAKRKAK